VTGRWILIRLLQLTLVIAIAWGVYNRLAPELSRLTWADVSRWRPAALPLLASFMLLLVMYAMHALLWRRIMRDLGIGNPSARATFRIFFLAGLGRFLPGKVWALTGMAVLSARAGLPPVKATAAAVLGSFAFLTTGLLVLGLTLPEWRLAVASETEVSATLPLAVGAALLAASGAVLWMLVATPLGHGFRERVVRALGPNLGERMAAAFALADRIRPRDAAVWAGAYALSWLVLGAAFLLFVVSFYPAAAALPRFVAGTVAASYLIGFFFFFVPAGIGVREVAMMVLLNQIMPEAGVALVVSVMSRVWFTAAELLPLLFLPLLKETVGHMGGQGERA
jgi:glycosyltransferase 2 family protein